MNINNHNIKRLGKYMIGKKKVGTQLMGVLIYHADMCRKAKTIDDIYSINEWMNKQVKYVVVRYLKTIGITRGKVYFDVETIAYKHSKKALSQKVKQDIERCNLWAEIELKREINKYLSRTGIEQKNFL